MYIVGLTGGIASGKTTVANILKTLDVPLCDTDELARKVVEKGSVGLEQVVSHFGKDILLEDNTLDRKKLADIIFNHAEERETLNRILHPLIFKEVNQWLDEQLEMQADVVIIDMPLLFEVGYDKQVDAVLSVFVQEDVQIERLISRNQYSYEEVKSRLYAQMPLIAKVKRSDYVIDNTGSVEDTIKQVIRWVNTVKSMIKR
ncbi:MULTISPECIES: dephospho-CoA kinase [unclassified Granulicatella]|uniref:dephospho-CoA kinase n=1 Tax=unclassified Granulicatella TaxID=2630493 RepID=UPI0010746A58|nr:MULTISPECIES: dephospho-CoA kinase [unclassified Granulicatella]MBF0779687.1 dephospho-CoA kinase [Granulicatella sp. 19428wC4_WM01]TFU96341.1 dephospho-CoA kinase [Granulicatella sp. WM01]